MLTSFKVSPIDWYNCQNKTDHSIMISHQYYSHFQIGISKYNDLQIILCNVGISKNNHYDLQIIL